MFGSAEFTAACKADSGVRCLAVEVFHDLASLAAQHFFQCLHYEEPLLPEGLLEALLGAHASLLRPVVSGGSCSEAELVQLLASCAKVADHC